MKRYKCMKCGLKQKIKEEQLVLKPREGHMTDSMHARCARCKTTEVMIRPRESNA